MEDRQTYTQTDRDIEREGGGNDGARDKGEEGNEGVMGMRDILRLPNERYL